MRLLLLLLLMVLLLLLLLMMLMVVVVRLTLSAFVLQPVGSLHFPLSLLMLVTQIEYGKNTF